MITENLSTLKIHKLIKEQYDGELESGNIDENALYLTPDEKIDLSMYVKKDDLEELETIPTVTIGNNGKFLRVVNDICTTVSSPNAEGG